LDKNKVSLNPLQSASIPNVIAFFPPMYYFWYMLQGNH